MKFVSKRGSRCGYRLALRCAALMPLAAASTSAYAQALDFNFGVIGQVIKTPSDATPLAQAITESDADSLAFIAVDGFKRIDEPCSDTLYQNRMDVLAGAKNGLVLSLASGDWAECKGAGGRSTAIERLGRLRELYFADEFSLGASKIPLIRQSYVPKFRSYVENVRWEVGNVEFTALNLPSNNNHYRMEAGRNSEFEDRMIANRYWLQHTFAIAARRKMTGIAIICDGNPLLKSGIPRFFESAGKRDGYSEIRQQLNALAAKFSGKVLVIHNQTEPHNSHSSGIVWHGNIGDLELGPGWTKVTVKGASSALFSATQGSTENSIGLP